LEKNKYPLGSYLLKVVIRCREVSEVGEGMLIRNQRVRKTREFLRTRGLANSPGKLIDFRAMFINKLEQK
jgi:hypothetical protein